MGWLDFISSVERTSGDTHYVVVPTKVYFRVFAETQAPRRSIAVTSQANIKLGHTLVIRGPFVPSNIIEAEVVAVEAAAVVDAGIDIVLFKVKEPEWRQDHIS